MHTSKTLIIGLVALAAAGMATPAQARHHHHDRHYRDNRCDHYHYSRAVYYRTPYYNDYDYGYEPAYTYYRPYPTYYHPYYQPGITLAFGGSGWHHHHHHW